jgi:hypothetical protein
MLLVIDGFPTDLMGPLGVEVIPQGTTGLVVRPRAQRCWCRVTMERLGGGCATQAR